MRKLKLFFSTRTIVLSFAVLNLLPFPVLAALPLIAPDHTIQIEEKEKSEEKPAWKKIWDMARQEARDGNYLKSKSLYLDLFDLKPNIIEARWEYAKLLSLLGDFSETAKILDSLLDLEPDNYEYLLAAGSTALKNSRYNQAVKYFGQVYESDPVGDVSETALEGLIKGFTGLGKTESVFLLLEQMYQRNPQDKNILEPLARLSRKLGYIQKARYYYPKLVKNFPASKKYIFDAAEVFDYQGFRSNAVSYWNMYLSLEDDYLPFHQKLADYYLDNDNPKLALPHLIKIYKKDFLSADLAFEIANLYYLKLKRPDKALLYYEQYALGANAINEVSKIIESIRNQLALEYLPIVENNATESLWNDLDLITLNKRLLFMKMAEMLHRKQKFIQETEVLEVLYDDKKDDLALAFRLSELYKSLGNPDKAYSMYQQLYSNRYENKEYLVDMAEIEFAIGEIQKCLSKLKEYLNYRPEDIKGRHRALKIAGESGLVDELYSFWHQIPEKITKSSEYLDIQLVFIESLRKNGLYSDADEIYVDIFSNLGKRHQDETRVYFHLADTLLQQNLLFEAEQIIRQVIAKDIDVEMSLEKLFRLSIREEQFTRARIWLNVLQERIREKNRLTDVSERSRFKLYKLELDLLYAQQEYTEAEDFLEEISIITGTGNKTDIPSNDLELYKVRVLFKLGEYEECMVLLHELTKNNDDNNELAVIEDIITVTDDNVSENQLKKKVNSGALIFFDLLERSQFYQSYGYPQRALNSLNIALEILPNSIVAKIRKIQIYSELSRYDDAVGMLEELLVKFPNQEYFDRLQLQLDFKRGNFKEVVAKVEKADEESAPKKILPVTERIVERKTIDAPPKTDIPNAKDSKQLPEKVESEDLYFWKKLLLARSLWADNRRDEAIKVYDSLLSAPVDSMFLEKVEVEKINFHLPPLKKSFWNIITFTNPDEPDPITTIMDPKFVANNIGQPVDDISASMYGKYRWQKLIRKELAARRATEERDYYRAEKEYLSLIKEEKSEDTLFDLAGIYNRLGLYGKEAELYELMKKKGPLYPGLDEYISANVLKRQPRISSSFYSSSRNGRDGYINIKEKSLGIEGWFMPTYDQELSIKLFHNMFGSYDNAPDLYSNSIIGEYSTYYDDILDLNISAGLNMPSDGGTNEVLMKFELIGRMSENVEAYGRFEQNIVDDTIYSVTESIMYRDLETGIKYDFFPRWFLGGDYRYRIYSDDNQQSRYKLWTMYHLFGEMNQFKVKYSYENIRNTDQNVGNVPSLARDPNQVDRLYWSPDIYWQHLFTMHFRHLFEKSSGPDSPISYWSVDYSIGLEDESNVNHEIDLNIFLEINRHFLLKGNFLNINGSDYEETTAGVSFIYRW